MTINCTNGTKENNFILKSSANQEFNPIHAITNLVIKAIVPLRIFMLLQTRTIGIPDRKSQRGRKETKDPYQPTFKG